jgi:hypothetical protein
MAIRAATAAETARERLAPALDTIDETRRQGKRILARGQHAADAVAAAALLFARTP